MSSGIRHINLEEIICWPHAADFKIQVATTQQSGMKQITYSTEVDRGFKV